VGKDNLLLQLLAVLPVDVVAKLAFHGCVLTKACQISSLSRGLSNQNFLITTGDSAFALRINSDASSAICHRRHEVANWRAVQDAMLAPRLKFVSDNYNYYLSEFIQVDSDWSKLMTANSAHPLIDCFEPWPGAERLLLSLLNGLSALPVPDNVMSVTQQWAEYLDSLSHFYFESSALSISSEQQKWHDRYRQLIRRKRAVNHLLGKLDGCMIALQFSHRDLNPHNLLLKKNKLYCIDFEYACSSHPLVDLASILATHRLSTVQRHWLITHYLDGHPRLTADALSAVPAAIELYWYFGCCWSLLMASQHSAVDKVRGNQLGDAPSFFSPHTFDDYIACFDDFFSLLSET
jgi:hypothetical protein